MLQKQLEQILKLIILINFIEVMIKESTAQLLTSPGLITFLTT
jgi:hypothetical protein